MAHQAWAWLYGVNFFIASHGEWSLSYIDHFWSLSVEEHFYFVWPLVVYLLAPRPRLRVALFTALAAMVARWIRLGHGAELGGPSSSSRRSGWTASPWAPSSP